MGGQGAPHYIFTRRIIPQSYTTVHTSVVTVPVRQKMEINVLKAVYLLGNGKIMWVERQSWLRIIFPGGFYFLSRKRMFGE